MITNKKELEFYVMADMMMNRGKYKWNIKDRLKKLIIHDYIMQYLKSMRYVAYMRSGKDLSICSKLICLIHELRYRKLGIKLGFSIGAQVFGYGLVIPHYGTIVVGASNRIGNYSVLHTSTCITDNRKVIGDGLYLSTGAKLTSQIELGDYVSIGANSLVNKSFGSNVMIAGTPAVKIKESEPWYIRDGEEYLKKVLSVNELKKKLNL